MAYYYYRDTDKMIARIIERHKTVDIDYIAKLIFTNRSIREQTTLTKNMNEIHNYVSLNIERIIKELNVPIKKRTINNNVTHDDVLSTSISACVIYNRKSKW